MIKNTDKLTSFRIQGDLHLKKREFLRMPMKERQIRERELTTSLTPDFLQKLLGENSPLEKKDKFGYTQFVADTISQETLNILLRSQQ